MSQPAISFDNLTCRFGKTLAVDHLNLEVPQGTIFGFLGENGAGKSTTIQVMMGLLRPTSGSVTMLGENPLGGNVSLLQRIGYMSEDRAMYRWMKVSEILDFNGGLYACWNKDLAKRLLVDFELELPKTVKELSRGQVAKLSLLCALAAEPELLVLDEPSSGLDPVVRRVIIEKLIEISSERGVTTFFSSHLIEEVDRLADYIAILCRGKLVISGTRDEVKSSLKRVLLPPGAKPVATSLGHPEWILVQKVLGAEIELIIRELDSEKLRAISEVSQSSPQVIDLALEDVFAKYTSWTKTKDTPSLTTVFQKP